MDSYGRPIDHLVWYFNKSESGFNKDILVPSEIIIEDKGLNTFSEIKKKKDLWWHCQCSSYEWIQSKHVDKKKWKMFKRKTLHLGYKTLSHFQTEVSLTRLKSKRSGVSPHNSNKNLKSFQIKIIIAL